MPQSPRTAPCVAVFGEVILDLIAGDNNSYQAHLGGSPYNVALGLARQHMPVALLSPLSDDPIGDDFANALQAAGGCAAGGRSSRPTSVALVWVGADGQPDYALHRGHVADLDTTSSDLIQRTPSTLQLAHTGALTLTPEAVHIVTPWMQWLREVGVVVSIDVNFRPRASPHLSAYIRAVERTYALCDLVKLSDEDLRGMGRTGSSEHEARRILACLPPESGLVVVTEGSRGALLMNRVARVRVDAISVEQVADTVGAGDCFEAGLLTALVESKLLKDHAYAHCSGTQLRALADRARVTAALNVSQTGCQPPSREAVDRALSTL